ncbi:MAG: DUF6391 domain-containing protein, partial [Planctomycetota bacterium]
MNKNSNKVTVKRIGWALRLAFKVMFTPMASLIVSGLLAFSVVAAQKWEGFGVAMGVLHPVPFFVVFFINLPLLGAFLRLFWLPEKAKINHALEHGTIQILRKAYGRSRTLSGSSSEKGFRISGAKRARDVESAFRLLLERLANGETRLAYARTCGSVLVTTQALGLIVFLGTAIAFIELAPALDTALVVVLTELLIVMLLRYPMGVYIQKRFFVSVRFGSAHLVMVEPVDPEDLFEKSPVFFVHTRIDQDRKKDAPRTKTTIRRA